MATNDILPFCPTDTGTNLLTQSEYNLDADRVSGNKPGVASSKLMNKSVRQSAFMSSQLAQYISDRTGSNVLDDGNTATLLAIMNAAFASKQEFDITNLAIAASVGSSALTVAIKTRAGTDPSLTDQVNVGFRSATIGSGVFVSRTISAALSMVISSGSTLGQTSGQASAIFVYLIDNAGTPELAVSHSYYPEDALVTTTAEGGAGGADSATVIYSTTARSNVALRLVGILTNTQATAGTWATAPSQIQLTPAYTSKVPTQQRFTSGSGTYNTPAGVKYIRVRMVGGGGQGGGSGSASAASGQAGNNSTFGTSLLTALGGGSGGAAIGVGGGGGNGTGGTINSPAFGSIIYGDCGDSYNAPDASSGGLGGGGGIFGGGGRPLPNLNSPAAGIAGTANTGGGGSGSSGNATTVYPGSGGGGAGAVDAIITTPLSSYSYAVGAGGTSSNAGTGGAAGGAGGSGYIEVTEYY